jgi:FtsZ-binding cell division protein ZapB
MENKMNKWPENIRLFVNGGPDDGCQLWDIWHDGGPGGHCFDAYSEQMANNIVSAIDELQSLREENKRLVLELSKIDKLLREGFDIINEHLSSSHEVWMEETAKLLENNND